MFRNSELSDLLYQSGTTLVGYADLSEVISDELQYGISIAVKILSEDIVSIHDGPNRSYFNAYHELNTKLNEKIALCGKCIEVCPDTQRYVSENL